MDATTIRAGFESRFAATVAALGPVSPVPGRPALALPPALRESLVAATLIDGGVSFEPLIRHYTETMPRLLSESLLGDDPASQLLRRPIDLTTTPRLRTALNGLFSVLAQESISARSLIGADSVATLIAERPSVAALYAPALFASGLPMVGTYPADRALIARELDGAAPEAVLDLRLAGHLVHELCHGPRVEMDAPPPPWMLAEAAAIHLGCTAFPRQVFPDQPGEAVPSLSRFVIIGDALARRFGRGALWRLLLSPTRFSTLFGIRASAAFTVAGWQDYLCRRDPPFARDALRAFAWAKLADAASGQSALDPLLDRAASLPPFEAARTLADLLDTADAEPFATLPWWSEEPTTYDCEIADRAVRAQFLVHRICPTFQTLPSEPPGGVLRLDVRSCTLSSEIRSDGVFAEPARSLIPPPLCRRLYERGARLLTIQHARRDRVEMIATSLIDLCCGLTSGSRPLNEETVLEWDSSP